MSSGIASSRRSRHLIPSPYKCSIINIFCLQGCKRFRIFLAFSNKLLKTLFGYWLLVLPISKLWKIQVIPFSKPRISHRACHLAFLACLGLLHSFLSFAAPFLSSFPPFCSPLSLPSQPSLVAFLSFRQPSFAALYTAVRCPISHFLQPVILLFAALFVLLYLRLFYIKFVHC